MTEIMTCTFMSFSTLFHFSHDEDLNEMGDNECSPIYLNTNGKNVILSVGHIYMYMNCMHVVSSGDSAS